MLLSDLVPVYLDRVRLSGLLVDAMYTKCRLSSDLREVVPQSHVRSIIRTSRLRDIINRRIITTLQLYSGRPDDPPPILFRRPRRFPSLLPRQTPQAGSLFGGRRLKHRYVRQHTFVDPPDRPWNAICFGRAGEGRRNKCFDASHG